MVGTMPTMPYRKNCSAPGSGLRELEEQRRCGEGDGADDQRPRHGANALDVPENIVDRRNHQRRHDAEQIAVLQLVLYETRQGIFRPPTSWVSVHPPDHYRWPQTASEGSPMNGEMTAKIR